MKGWLLSLLGINYFISLINTKRPAKSKIINPGIVETAELDKMMLL